MNRWIFLVLAIMLAGSVGAQAVPAAPPLEPPMTADQQREFEDTHLISAQVDFWGIRYELNGKEIQNEQELENLMATQKDALGVQELKDSEDHESLSWMLMGGGSGMAITGGILTWNHGSNTFTNILILGGLVMDTAGGWINRESRTEQLDAVNRYNQLVRQENGISFLPLSNPSRMALAYFQRF